MVVIVADRWDPAIGGRERYAGDLLEYLRLAGRPAAAAHPRDPLPTAERILALTPHRDATHYQLHGGLMAHAFAAERESLESQLQRALYNPALAINRRRQRLLDDEARMLDRQVACMTFCEADAGHLRARGLDAHRIVVSRPGIDLTRFRPPASMADDLPAEPLRLVFAAHNFVLKGLHSGIQAVARAHHAGLDVRLTVIGRGASTRFRRLAAREGIADRVTFAGGLTQHGMAEAFQASHVLLHPTYHDPFPRVVIEAMASGCAVITTSRCGASEILVEGRDSLIVRDPRDVEGLASAIGRIGSQLTPMRHAASQSARQLDQLWHFRQTSVWLCGNGIEA